MLAFSHTTIVTPAKGSKLEKEMLEKQKQMKKVSVQEIGLELLKMLVRALPSTLSVVFEFLNKAFVLQKLFPTDIRTFREQLIALQHRYTSQYYTD